MNDILKISNLHFKIDGFEIIKNVNFSIYDGEFVAFVGPNGCGKTTLLNIINGFLLHDEGDIIYNGVKINIMSATKRVHLGIGRLWQDLRLFNNITVLENLLVSQKDIFADGLINNLFKIKKIKQVKKELIAKAEYYLEVVDLIDKRYIEAENLSYGQQKLLAICRLLINDAQLLLLDEPFSGLNPIMVEKIHNILEFLKNDKKTAIVIEHGLGKIENIVDRMYGLHQGKIIVQGIPKEVIQSNELREAYAGI